MEVGFIGLGRMGRAMARNLLKAGHRVFVFNRTRSRAEELRDEGAEVADSPAGACKGDIVITMLADDNAVEEIVLGSGGIIKALRENAIHLSMSTITVALSEALTEAHYAVGKHFVAAPVFGRPEAAAAAKLFIVAAGEPEPLDRCEPLFDELGQKTFVVDQFPPKANLVKLSGNFLVASVIECLGEAVALIRKAGVDPTQFLGILTCSLFAAPCTRPTANSSSRTDFARLGSQCRSDSRTCEECWLQQRRRTSQCRLRASCAITSSPV
jgi:3-hydroxyisobutyrate dehydrogenase-like beta-hydroxyacid dehydrogenase